MKKKALILLIVGIFIGPPILHTIETALQESGIISPKVSVNVEEVGERWNYPLRFTVHIRRNTMYPIRGIQIVCKTESPLLVSEGQYNEKRKKLLTKDINLSQSNSDNENYFLFLSDNEKNAGGKLKSITVEIASGIETLDETKSTVRITDYYPQQNDLYWSPYEKGNIVKDFINFIKESYRW